MHLNLVEGGAVQSQRQCSSTTYNKTWESIQEHSYHRVNRSKKTQATKSNIRKNDYGCKSKNVARLSQSFVRIFQPLRNFFIAGLLAASAS